jgi:hypothetical protein
LTRKQKESRRGRAELLLADRAAVWTARPENRQLPSVLQWLQIRRWTQKKTWTPPQQKMMRRATRYHLLRGALTATLVVLLALLGGDLWGRVQAHHLRDRLLDANTADVPAIVKDIGPYRRWLNPLLRDASAQAQRDGDPHKQLHASLALALADPDQVPYLRERLLTAQAAEITAIRQALAPYQAQLREDLWAVLANPRADLDQRLRAACALAAYTPDDPRWQEVRRDVAARLAVQRPTELGAWAEALRPVGAALLPPLAAFLQDEQRSAAERAVSATLYKTLAQDQPDAFARLEGELDRKSIPTNSRVMDLSNAAQLKWIKEKANVGVALVIMGRGDKVWPLLKHSPDPTLRSYLIDRLAPGGAEPRFLLTRLEQEADVSIRRALLLSLGEFGMDRLPQVERQNYLPRLLDLYRDDPDPGIHGAAEWLLRRWGAEARVEDHKNLQPFQEHVLAGQLLEARLREIDKELQRRDPDDRRGWYVNRQGQTLALVDKPGTFWKGEGQERHQQTIAYSYAIGTKEVTVAQFTLFRNDQRKEKQYGPTGDCPMMEVSWHDAAAYCNWLGEKEGIAKDQWCYELAGKEGEMKVVATFLQRTGYHLATEAEWEYACRAGGQTGYCYGESDELLTKYGWFTTNSMERSHPVGVLKPNDLGLFDMHGNVWEWCHDAVDPGASHRVLRGGSLDLGSGICRAAARPGVEPSYRNVNLGFRLARAIR